MNDLSDNTYLLKHVLAGIPSVLGSVHAPLEPAPKYQHREGPRVALAVESMKRHMTDEGWQIMEALETTGYKLYGARLPHSETDVARIVEAENPSVVLVQDKREWDNPECKFRDQEARFNNVGILRDHPAIFKLTILKDAHQRNAYHRDAAEEMGAHAWVVYYNPEVVQKLAPYVRPRHLIRTYHSLDRERVPDYSPKDRRGTILSGAISDAYPWRKLLRRKMQFLPLCEYRPHPGYHADGCETYNYLQKLTQYKVAICTASRYGYTLRKMVEATACGCVVVTDLPSDEKLPVIDDNLVRVNPGSLVRNVGTLLSKIYQRYDPERQKHFAELAKGFYDFRAVGQRLASDIERMRRTYRA